MADRDPRLVGARIAKRRHQLDWSQVELARKLGVSPSTVANWERGASYPKKKLGKVEQVLGISLDGEPEPEPAVPQSVIDAIRRAVPDPEDQDRAIGAVERELRGEPPPTGPGAAARSSGSPRRAG